MKIIYLVFLTSLLHIACNSNTNKKNQSKIEGSKEPLLKYKTLKGRGVLIGDDILLLDSHLQMTRNISDMNTVIVDLEAITEETHFPDSNDHNCGDHPYILIRSNKTKGWIDGRQVYQICESLQDTSLAFGNIRFSILTTRYFGVPEFTEEGLTECSGYNPIVFHDSRSGYKGLVRIKGGKFADSVIWYQETYFQLNNNDGFFDRIESARMEGEALILKINVQPQEGWVKAEVAITRGKDGIYYAELIAYQHGD